MARLLLPLNTSLFFRAFFQKEYKITDNKSNQQQHQKVKTTSTMQMMMTTTTGASSLWCLAHLRWKSETMIMRILTKLVCWCVCGSMCKCYYNEYVPICVYRLKTICNAIVMHYGTQPLVKIEGQFTSYRAGMFKFVDGTFHGFVLMILFAYVFMLRNTFFVGWVDTHTPKLFLLLSSLIAVNSWPASHITHWCCKTLHVWNSEYGLRPQDASKFLSPWKLAPI